MNTGILRKVLEELEKDNPRLDYIRGMVETLVEMDRGVFETSKYVPTSDSAPIMLARHVDKPTEGPDEAAILDGQARAAIDRVKALAAESNVE